MNTGGCLIDKGLSSYGAILQLQEELFNRNLDAKSSGHSTVNYLVLCEHLPVYTLGKSGSRDNILVSDKELNAEFYKINRGGDVTFHGPGQLVAYPILDLESLHIGLAQYVLLLEQVMIDSLVPFGLKAERMEGAAGIWLRENNSDRKIGAIGVKASRNITMHGIAVNVNTALTYFDKIVPCGLAGKGTTSIQQELGKEISMTDYKSVFVNQFEAVLGIAIQKCSES